ncbi:MAG: preprotein translocase subunit YajC [Oscillospiraceae bacterium]|jgi:preprotein translocase subunit YajC|nr:preprotein translocase subunit YajC [Oscillospiraceae bacterium]
MLLNFMQTVLTTGTSGATNQRSMYGTLIMMGGLFVVMYLFMIRPQKKKQKSEQDMRDSIQIGDEITTIGGIMGRVVTVKEDSLIVETGADRNKLRITRWAIQTNNSAEERSEAEKAAAKAIKDSERAEREKAVGPEIKEKKKRRSKKSEDDT